MKNIASKLAAAAFLVGLTAAPAVAGKGGSAGKIRAAVASASVDAIIAEVERAESLMCEDCIDIMVRLTEDARYPVREVAAWWIAKRPTLHRVMTEQFTAELVTGDSQKVRNAADFLGASSTFRALPELRAAIRREVDTEAKLAIVRAVDLLGNLGGNDVLTVAMADANAAVRAAAARAWRDIRGQRDAGPAAGLLADADAGVRAEAATVVGGLRHAAAAGALETLVVADPSPIVRKNAAWALGKIGAASSRAALAQAANDPSGFVRLAARAALAQLR
jgi:HEAT repeat protein